MTAHELMISGLKERLISDAARNTLMMKRHDRKTPTGIEYRWSVGFGKWFNTLEEALLDLAETVLENPELSRADVLGELMDAQDHIAELAVENNRLAAQVSALTVALRPWAKLESKIVRAWGMVKEWQKAKQALGETSVP